MFSIKLCLLMDELWLCKIHFVHFRIRTNAGAAVALVAIFRSSVQFGFCSSMFLIDFVSELFQFSILFNNQPFSINTQTHTPFASATAIYCNLSDRIQLSLQLKIFYRNVSMDLVPPALVLCAMRARVQKESVIVRVHLE